uniref:Uncharacterized protein n=1 Tax=Rhipicephalus appendiculatus TaxID=34631 RepID=A0A131YA03_RHIAP
MTGFVTLLPVLFVVCLAIACFGNYTESGCILEGPLSCIMLKARPYIPILFLTRNIIYNTVNVATFPILCAIPCVSFPLFFIWKRVYNVLLDIFLQHNVEND